MKNYITVAEFQQYTKAYKAICEVCREAYRNNDRELYAKAKADWARLVKLIKLPIKP